MRKVLFFFINDFKDRLKKHGRLFLAILPYILIGIIVGAIVVSKIEDPDYILGFAVIFTNEFKPFKTFFTFAVIMLILMAFTYVYSKSKIFGLLFRAVCIYMGYVVGRIAGLCVINSVFHGISSIIFFILPALVTITFCVFFALSNTYDRPLCGLSPKNNSGSFRPCLKGYLVGVSILFLIEVVFGGIVNLLVNIVT